MFLSGFLEMEFEGHKEVGILGFRGGVSVFGVGKRHCMLQFWILVSKFYLRSILAVDISSFCLAKKVVVVRMVVTVGYHTGPLRLCLGLQFQHAVLKICNKTFLTNSAVGKML